jgi:hypothetical protein
MLIEIKSSATDPSNTANHMLQMFKETLILKPRTRIALVNALITTDTNYYANLVSGGIWTNSHSGYEIKFSDVGANNFFQYWTDGTATPTTANRWYQPLGEGKWNFYETEPTATNINDGTNVPKILTSDINTGVLNLASGTPFIPSVIPTRVYHNTGVSQGTETILVNLTNFPINSRNASGNTDNHIATIPILQNVNDNSNPTNFYEPFNANFHRLDNEADLNLNHIEVSLQNADGTPRTDLKHPTQLTFLLTPDYT